jgi:CubicO group peptidase (beta-lactamase class C family)
MTSVQTPHVTSLGLRYGLSVGLSMEDARGTYPLPIGGFGWYGIFGTWFWAWPAHRAVVLLFSHVLDSTMSFPLFSGVATAVERRLIGSTSQEDRR